MTEGDMTDTQTEANDNSSIKKPGIAAFFERSALIMFGLGFSSGVPNQLAGVTLAIWLAESGISLSIITLLGLATLTYSLKFLWSPLVDQVGLPILDKLLGRRRSWMIFTQFLVVIGLIIIANCDPTKSLIPFAIMASLIAFAGATQDIAIDAWRIEVSTDEKKLGILTATYQWGYRVAILVSGAVPLLVAQYFNGDEYKQIGWTFAYLTMTALMIIPVLATIFAPKEAVPPSPRWVPPAHIPNRPILELVEWGVRLLIMCLGAAFVATGLSGKAEPISWLVGDIYGGFDAMKAAITAKPWGVWQQFLYAAIGLFIVFIASMKIPKIDTKPAAYFDNALGAPLKEFFTRFENVASLILIFICLYRIADFLLNVAGPLYLAAGFSKDEIAIAQKGFGLFASAFGVGIAGWAMLKLDVFKCLVIGAFMQPISNLFFGLIAIFGDSPFPFFNQFGIQPVLWGAIGIDNIAASFAGTALVVYMSRLTKAGFTATQYAFFSSLYALPGKLIAALSGRVVEAAAFAAEKGGLSFLKPLFTKLPKESFVKPATELGINASSLAIGYFTFFFYTAILGVVAIILSFIIAKGKAREIVED